MSSAAHPIELPTRPVEPPTSEGDKPPPAGGGWGYVSDQGWGWGYFPQLSDKPNPVPPPTQFSGRARAAALTTANTREPETMRIVPLKIVAFARPAGQPLRDLRYSEALVVIAKAPAGGLDSGEMDTALPIEEAIAGAVEEQRDYVLLEEALWGRLAECVKQNRWPFASLSSNG